MGNCKIAKFNGTFADDSLPKYSELKLTFKNTTANSTLVSLKTVSSVLYEFSSPVNIQAVSGGAILAENVTSYDASSVTDIYVISHDGGDVVITCKNKYVVSKVYVLHTGEVSLDYMTFLSNVLVTLLLNASSSVVMSSTSRTFKEATQLYQVQLRNSNISGDISDFGNKPDLTSIQFNGGNVDISGDVSSLKDDVKLIALYLDRTQVSGNMDIVLNSLAASGRTNSLSVALNLNISLTGRTTASLYTIKFNSSMVNPTPEETARGWQIA